MKIYKNLKSIGQEKISLTIGNFDGVHLGHKKILKFFIEESKKMNLTPVLMTFNPHPMCVLKGEKSFLITSYDQKIDELKNIGIEHIVEITFDHKFSHLGAEEFLEKFIDKRVKAFFWGYDMSFGEGKKGNRQWIEGQFPGKIIDLEKTIIDQELLSSSLIRKIIKSGDMNKVKKYLGRAFVRRGKVVKAFGRGKTIGFPTANIAIEEEPIYPPPGVYAGFTYWKEKKYKSVTNIGFNPTFDNLNKGLETHILDFDENLYGEEIQVEFFERLRDEQKFSSINELIDQITKDVEKCRKIL